jgi:hypothetical protein
MKIKVLFPILFVALQGCDSETSSKCEKYASKFSCDFVEKQATYKVFYWKDVLKGNEQDNRFVGMSIGLFQCRDIAVNAHRAEMEYRKSKWKNWSESDDNWSERSYICMLTKDGKDLEKHRL